MAQKQYPIGTVLKSPFGGTVTVKDASQFFSDQYVPSSTSTTSGSTTSSTSNSGNTTPIKIYDSRGNEQTVYQQDFDGYWSGQGWSTTKPTTGTATPVTTTDAQSSLSNPERAKLGTFDPTTGKDVPVGELPAGWSTSGSGGNPMPRGFVRNGNGEQVADPRPESYWPKAPAAAPDGVPDPSNIASLDGVVYPPELLEADWFKALTPEQQDMIKLGYAGETAGNAAARADANDALEEAKKMFDPYFKSQIALVQDELTRTNVKTEADFQSQSGTLQKRIQALDDDLNFNRENLSIEEQADLARQKRQYEVQLEGLRTSAQESGLVFSSPRDLAEQRLKVSADDTAQSTQRRYSTQLRNLEVQAQRERIATEQHQIDLERAKGESVTSTARAAESKLGTKNLPGGTEKLGTEVAGTIEQQRKSALLDMQNSIIDRGTPDDPLNL